MNSAQLKKFLTMSPAFKKALATNSRAQKTWDDITFKMQRDWILWMNTAKLEETRKKRMERACTDLAKGKRKVCCFGGYNWIIKSL